MKFLALIRKTKSQYAIEFPDFPGLMPVVVDQEEIKANEEIKTIAEKYLKEHIEDLKHTNKPIPTPSSFDDIMAKPGNMNAEPILIEVSDL